MLKEAEQISIFVSIIHHQRKSIMQHACVSLKEERNLFLTNRRPEHVKLTYLYHSAMVAVPLHPSLLFA
jgi:hypothetical protein